MKKNIKVVIGAAFGDEGKGLMVDYFCNQAPKNKKILNVRFNGSSQSGHTVVTENERHIFSHFGAGTFNSNVITYLSSFFIVNPIGFMKELDILTNQHIIPKVLVCKDSTVLLPFDSMLNIFKETARGKDRHGSCGMGVFEAVVRVRNEELNLKVSDLQYGRNKLFGRLKEIRDTYYIEKLNEIGVEKMTSEELDLFFNDDVIINFIEDLKEMLQNIRIVDDNILNEYEYQVYEGSQGLLLDWGNREYMPNLTASYTGLKNVIPLLNNIQGIEKDNIEICYVVRSYFTRHGAGKFVTEVASKENLGYNIVEKTNMTNEWQGSFRFGYFDRPLLIKNINRDLEYFQGLNYTPDISLAITHLDQTENKVLLGQGNEVNIKEFIKNMVEIKFNRFYISEGETRKNIRNLKRGLKDV